MHRLGEEWGGRRESALEAMAGAAQEPPAPAPAAPAPAPPGALLVAAAAYIGGVCVARTPAARLAAHRLWFPPDAIDARYLAPGARTWR